MEAKIVQELRAMSTTSGRFGAEDLSRLLRDAADIIAKLPVTADGVPVVESGWFYFLLDGTVERVWREVTNDFGLSGLYSAQAAAEAAKGGE